jgi:hypothetical protein
MKISSPDSVRADQNPSRVACAIVHHANQYLISNGYANRPGISSVVGSVAAKRGMAYVLEMHRTYNIPANLHVSGTLLESLAWHEPGCLKLLREMYEEGWIEIISSAYGQNIMRFFDHEYNFSQIEEQLGLYKTHLGVEPECIKAFWPPERVWDTSMMAATLRDATLSNGGFDYVFVDDRILYSSTGHHSPRHLNDTNPIWDPALFRGYPVVGGHGLIALPIAENLRHCIPPRSAEQARTVDRQLRWLGANYESDGADLLGIYADDMEKPAAIGWDAEGPLQFAQFLQWLSQAEWISPVKCSEWAKTARMGEPRVLEPGTYKELAVDFNAGEGYEKWFLGQRWAPHLDLFRRSEKRVHSLTALGADPKLIQLADKHLLVSSWESAWYTPLLGAHGDAAGDGGPSGFSRAVASHSRHAVVIAEAAHWKVHKDQNSHCFLFDIDGDGEQELILKNAGIFAVISPRRGGRIVALFSVGGENGAMVVGNPSDDWNLKEELNDYMDVPRNHPGAMADVGFEHDSYTVQVMAAKDGSVSALLTNECRDSSALGMTKKYSLVSYEDEKICVEYALPGTLSGLEVECGLSPDYLRLLREGISIVSPYENDGARGWRTDRIAVWVKPGELLAGRWSTPYQLKFGHGLANRLTFDRRCFSIWLGVERMPQVARSISYPETNLETKNFE